MSNYKQNDLAGDLAPVNSETKKIQEAVSSQLDRNPASGQDNAMETELDMNSFRVINVGKPENANDAARLKDVNAVTAAGLPDQTGEAGKFLTTDGEIASWATVSPENGVFDLTTAEVNQLKNINTVTVSNQQWAYLGNLDQGVSTSDNVDFNGITINGDEVQAFDQSLNTTDDVEFNTLTLDGEQVHIATVGTRVELGAGSSVGGSHSVAVGNNASTADRYSVAIGDNASTADSESIAIGLNTRTLGFRDVAVGVDCETDGNGVGIGWNTTSASNSIAIGYGASATDTNSVVVGNQSNATSQNSVVIGRLSNAFEDYGVAIGYSATARGSSVSIGDDAGGAEHGIAIGRDSLAGGTGGYAVAIGDNARVTGGSYDSVAIGRDTEATGSDSVALGHGAKGYTESIVISNDPAGDASALPEAINIGHRGTAASNTAHFGDDYINETYLYGTVYQDGVPLQSSIHEKIKSDAVFYADFTQDEVITTSGLSKTAQGVAAGITYTAPDGQTGITAAGEVADAGIDTPPIVYGGEGNCLGLQVAPSSTNELLNSKYDGAGTETPPTDWIIGGGSTGTTEARTSAFRSTATTVVQSGTDAREFLQQTVFMAAGETKVFSAWFEEDTDAVGTVMDALGETAGGISTSVEGADINGAGRYYGVVTQGSTDGNVSFRIGLGVSTTDTGTVSHTLPQIEDGATPTPWIETTTAQVTRGESSALKNIQINKNKGALYFEGVVKKPIDAQGAASIVPDSGGSNNAISILYRSAGSIQGYFYSDNGTAISSVDVHNNEGNFHFKALVVYNYDTNEGRIYCNGQAGPLRTLNKPTDWQAEDFSIAIGKVNDSTGPTDYVECVSLYYMPTVPSDAEAIRLTTL